MRYIDTNCTVKEGFDPHQYTFTGLWTVTKLPYSITIEADNLFKFRQSDDIMDTGLNADDREFAISGISPTGCNQLFGEEELFQEE